MKYKDELAAEFETMLENGKIPIMEFALTDGDFLNVAVSVAAENLGLDFSFATDERPTNFQDNVYCYSPNHYILYFSDSFSLDEHLQAISEQLTEGYLLPNNLI